MQPAVATIALQLADNLQQSLVERVVNDLHSSNSLAKYSTKPLEDPTAYARGKRMCGRGLAGRGLAGTGWMGHAGRGGVDIRCWDRNLVVVAFRVFHTLIAKRIQAGASPKGVYGELAATLMPKAVQCGPFCMS